MVSILAPRNHGTTPEVTRPWRQHPPAPSTPRPLPSRPPFPPLLALTPPSPVPFSWRPSLSAPKLYSLALLPPPPLPMSPPVRHPSYPVLISPSGVAPILTLPLPTPPPLKTSTPLHWPPSTSSLLDTALSPLCVFPYPPVAFPDSVSRPPALSPPPSFAGASTNTTLVPSLPYFFPSPLLLLLQLAKARNRSGARGY